MTKNKERFESLNTIEVCAACKTKIFKGEKKIMHHTSYYPEIKVPVHKSCHTQIHAGTAYGDLLPDYRQTIRFYKYTQYARISNLSKTIPKFFQKIDRIERYHKKHASIT